MSMSTHVTGFTPPDDRWTAMKAIWDACLAAGVLVPDEVETFFGDQDPDPAGVEIALPLREWQGQDSTGYELDLTDIPAHVTTIRFYNSW
jgi:hypothetical protein